MHFFTEPVSLQQSVSNSYGPISGNEDTMYNVSSVITAGTAKLFACQDAMMLVQPSTNTSLVNIILKPISGLEIPFNKVQYYIYRGVDINDFLSGSNIASNDLENRTQFITRFWEHWENYKINTKQPTNLAPPGPKSFGYDTAISGVTNVEELFNSVESTNVLINDFQAIRVKEGEWIGNTVASTEFCFEIITDTDHLTIDLDYVRKTKHIIDVSTMPDSTPAEAFAIKAEKEKILNYIDPAAFFGMHSDVGVKNYDANSYDSTTITTTTTLKKDDGIFDLIQNLQTKNAVYLDVRSEKGYSYNHYGNYGNYIYSGATLTAIELFLIKSVSNAGYHVIDFFTLDWPIIDVNQVSQMVVGERINLKLRVDDNTEPLLFVQNPKLLGKKNKNNFIQKEALDPTDAYDWTEDINLETPSFDQSGSIVNIAYYIKFQYLRQRDNSSSPNTVLKNGFYLDSIFGGINNPRIDFGNIGNEISHSKLTFVNNGFSNVRKTGVYYDSSSIVFYSESTYINKTLGIDFPAGSFKAIKDTVLPNNFTYNKIQVDDGTDTIDIIELVGVNKITSKAAPKGKNYFLGIIKTELNMLNGLISEGITDLHHKYFVFEEVLNQSDVNEKFTFRKFKLKIQGVDNQGIKQEDEPLTPIYVYGSNPRMLCSSDFAALVNLPIEISDPGVLEPENNVGERGFNKVSIGGSNKFTINDFDLNSKGDLVSKSFNVNLYNNLYFPTILGGLTNDVANVKQGKFPLIAIVHGNGQKFYDYNELSKFLSNNGFIVVTIDVDRYLEDEVLVIQHPNASHLYYFKLNNIDYFYNITLNQFEKYNSTQTALIPAILPFASAVIDNPSAPTKVIFNEQTFKAAEFGSLGRANILYKHLEFIKNQFASTNIIGESSTTSLSGDLGLIGHSRGGEAIVTASRLFSSQTSLSPFFTIKGLLSLSPSDQYHIEKLNSIPFLVIYGSKDGDLSPIEVRNRVDPSSGNKENIVSMTGFSLWDRATNQEKVMITVKGATHNGFVTNNRKDYFRRDSKNPSQIYYDTGRTNKDDYFASESVQNQILLVYTNAFFRRYLLNETYWNPVIRGHYVPPSAIDGKTPINFQKLGYNSVISQDNSFEPTDLNFVDGKAYSILRFDSGQTLDVYSPHGKELYLIDLNKYGQTYNDFNELPLNATNYDYFSFRMTKIYKEEPDLSNFLVSINGISSLIGDVVRSPDRRYDKDEYTKDDAQTIIIPLGSFVGLNKGVINSISLDFGTTTGKLAFNDFEFIKA